MPSPSFDVQLRSEQTHGDAALIKVALPSGFAGPPLHHHDFDEAWWILDGELTFQLADEVVVRGPGSLTFAARGEHHTLANLSDAPATYLLLCTPAGFERYFDGLQAEITGRPGPPEATGSYPETIVVGPPIARAP